jgi:hypothetical protein
MQVLPGLRIFLCTLFLLYVAGCGGSGGRLAVSGTVTYKGVPVEQGSIAFIPTAGKGAYGASIFKGTFAIPADRGLEPGTYKVMISSTVVEGKPPLEPGGPDGPQPKELIPAKYNSQTTLTREIKAGQAKLAFNLD